MQFNYFQKTSKFTPKDWIYTVKLVTIYMKKG